MSRPRQHAPGQPGASPRDAHIQAHTRTAAASPARAPPPEHRPNCPSTTDRINAAQNGTNR